MIRCDCYYCNDACDGCILVENGGQIISCCEDCTQFKTDEEVEKELASFRNHLYKSFLSIQKSINRKEDNNA